MSKSGYPKHDAMRLKAEKAFGAAELRACDKPARPSDFYGSKIHVRRVKKNMGGAMPSAGILGLPAYIMDAVSNVAKSHLKHGGKVCHKPVKRSMGGPMSFSGNVADNIQQANQLLSNAASNGIGLKRGGHASQKHSMRHKRASGGAMAEMSDRDFAMGKKALGLNHGGRTCGYDMGGEVKRAEGGEMKKAMGGTAKIRHGQMTRKGAQIAPRARFKG